VLGIVLGFMLIAGLTLLWRKFTGANGINRM
jgi:hypothetical protein